MKSYFNIVSLRGTIFIPQIIFDWTFVSEMLKILPNYVPTNNILFIAKIMTLFEKSQRTHIFLRLLLDNATIVAAVLMAVFAEIWRGCDMSTRLPNIRMSPSRWIRLTPASKQER